MCGRAEVHHSEEEIRRHLGLDGDGGSDQTAEIKPSYNLAPTDPIPVVRRRDTMAPNDSVPVIRQLGKLGTMRWGLTLGNRKAGGFNVRVESLGWGIYRENVRTRRCLVVLSSFYEWRNVGGKKYPYLIRREDSSPLVLAGFYDSTGGCAVLTKPSEGIIARLHARMPVMLERAQWAAWLDPAVEDVSAIVHGANADGMACHPVPSAVSSVANNDRRLLEPVAEPSAGEGRDPATRSTKQLGLF